MDIDEPRIPYARSQSSENNIRFCLGDISTRVIAHHALATDDIYEACRDNWIATLKHLGERLGALLDAEQLRSALGELERVSGDELLVETTVLAWGTKP